MNWISALLYCLEAWGLRHYLSVCVLRAELLWRYRAHAYQAHFCLHYVTRVERFFGILFGTRFSCYAHGAVKSRRACWWSWWQGFWCKSKIQRYTLYQMLKCYRSSYIYFTSSSADISTTEENYIYRESHDRRLKKVVVEIFSYLYVRMGGAVAKYRCVQLFLLDTNIDYFCSFVWKTGIIILCMKTEWSYFYISYIFQNSCLSPKISYVRSTSYFKLHTVVNISVNGVLEIRPM